MTEHPTEAPERPRVTVIIPARNEIERWPAVLAHLRAQTLQPSEVIVADGMSTDGSRWWLADAARTYPPLLVVDNPARHVAGGLNAALAAATGEIIARMDTHADYEPTYLSALVDFLIRTPHAAGAGGAMRTAGEGPWGRAIASVLRRPIGLGGARHRVGGAPGPIVHVFSGCYRRSALQRVGGWDMRLRANEDFECDVRVAATGSAVWLVPSATPTWYVRRNPQSLAVQMWRYGYYKGLTLHLHPSSLQLRQLAPPALVVGLVTGSVVAPAAAAIGLAAYAVASAMLGAHAARIDGANPFRGAVVPAVIHLSWGAGLLAGLVRFVGAGSARPGECGTLG